MKNSESKNENVSKVNLGNYKGLKVNEEKPKVKEEQIDAEIERLKKSQSTLEEVNDRAVEKGDTVNIDFEGFADGKAFEGGKGENVDLEIGSGSFIPGFENQIIGKNINDSFDINVQFPGEYQNSDLAGKKATFKTVLNKISVSQKPEADDEFAKNVDGSENIDALRDNIRNKLMENAKVKAKEKMSDQLLSKIIDSSEFELTPDFVASQAQRIKEDYKAQLSQQGLTLENYLKMNNSTMEQFDAMLQEQAKSRAKAVLTLREIAKQENISISPDEKEAEYASIAEMYKIPLEDLKKRFRPEDEEMIDWVITSRKVFDLIMDNSEIVKK